MMNLGNVVAESTVRIPFSSFDAAGASDATTSYDSTDVKIYKDDETTPRSSANGITATAGINSRTGLNTLSIDLSDTTVAAYYEVGSTYTVAVDEVTIDGETVRFWIGQFEIQKASSVGQGAGQGAVRHFFKNGSIDVPSWATSVVCGAVGAGGDGFVTAFQDGGGGGGGGYAEGVFDDLAGETLSITVASTPSSSSSITASSSGTLVTGNGGTSSTSQAGGAGGTGSGGDFQASGGTGGSGSNPPLAAGGGGAAGTAHGNGGDGGTNATISNAGGGGSPGGSATTDGSGAAFANSSSQGFITGATPTAPVGQLPLTYAISAGNGGSANSGEDGDFMCGGAGSNASNLSGNGGAFAGGGGNRNAISGNGGIGGGGGGGLTGGGKGGSGYCFVQFIP